MRAWLLMLVACAQPAMPIDDYSCPPQGTIHTYESFGRAFLATHCNDCHNASENNRHGAPESFRFETLAEIRQHKARMFVRAAASNTSMPPGPEDPDSDDRERLAEWLACGAP